MDRSPHPLPSLKASVLLAALATLAYCWVVTLAFQIDDYYLIPKATCFTKSLGSMLLDPAHLFGGGPPLLDPAEHPHFQPTLWLLLAGLHFGYGEPVSAPLFHGAILLLHAFATALSLRVFSRFLPPIGAVFGAVILAILPAGAQSVSWVSAGSHVLAVIFGLLAMDLILKPRVPKNAYAKRSLLVGVCLALAFCSHVESLSWIAVAIGLIALRERTARSRLFACGLALLPLLAVAFIRMRFLGSWS
jgi:hypothetical protein